MSQTPTIRQRSSRAQPGRWAQLAHRPAPITPMPSRFAAIRPALSRRCAGCRANTALLSSIVDNGYHGAVAGIPRQHARDPQALDGIAKRQSLVVVDYRQLAAVR